MIIPDGGLCEFGDSSLSSSFSLRGLELTEKFFHALSCSKSSVLLFLRRLPSIMVSFSSLLHSSALILSLVRSHIYLPSSCVDQEDGSQWLKMLDDSHANSYPAVKQMCHNEYMVIDVNEDPNVAEYFSSYTNWHYAISGPEIMDSGNWESWWLPSAQYLDDGVGGSPHSQEYFQFVISPDCSSCDLDNNVDNNVYSLFSDDNSGERTAYYMTGHVLYDYNGECIRKNCVI